ncbi:sphingosine hydroxylase [Collybia nuda]|uniref:Sphingosine hydroxylase n=1 Tax=Collybia nuda TaxID=64659 RepID=A0A9P5XTB7_9AGAR|nr:sphingosine hydroxylase [Collybia nuda]
MNSTLYHTFLDGKKAHVLTNVPLYYSHKSSLVNHFPDHYLALASPVIAYWTLSLFFHYLDTSDWKWLEKHRIHESAEVKSRNRVTRSQVVWGVLFQQLIQTLLGLAWLSDDGFDVVNHEEKMRVMAQRLEPVLSRIIGDHLVEERLLDIVYLVYWWAIPTVQFIAAMFFIDTWQYFLHRLMHVNKFMYKQFHSWHHRLYVPYAFGSLYNHPVEGFVLDSLGAAIAESLTGLTTRQAMLLFSFSTLKTVDDHCGYNFPYDPFQWMSGNNADYHDIHHQVVGIKSNFAQPFFVHWDTLMGTRMTRKDIELRKKKAFGKAE